MFGYKFVEMRIARDLIIVLHYKSRIFGVPLDGPSDVMCDNQGLFKNTRFPQFTLI